MSLDSILFGLRRVPWSVLKPLLTHLNIDSGRGWDETASKLKSLVSGISDKESELAEQLFPIYKEHLLAGEKTVRFFRMDSAQIRELSSGFYYYNIPVSLFKKAYPFSLEERDLREVRDGVHLVDVTEYNGRIHLVFCSKRTISERTHITRESFEDPEYFQTILGKYNDVIGIQRHDRQFFDVIVLDTVNGFIELRLDIGDSISLGEREYGFQQLRKIFENLLSQLIGSNFDLGTAVNLFPAINKLYRSDEGRVCELAFTTESGTIRHEKMRRKHECLRSDTYHKGGNQAVNGHITAYRIAVTWEYQKHSLMTTQPELLLPGNSIMLSRGPANLYDAVISHCADLMDYELVVKKLTGFLEQNEPAT
ncbi:MAG: hypothetical protein PHP00_05710 [Thiotrichaceae bacterium]|nr:hypothetical protein [Thiotrichaceae bacterium]